MKRRAAMLVAALHLATLALPASAAEKRVELDKARGEVPEERLLDVAVQVFDPGIPAGKDELELEKAGIFPSVRNAEARFIPLQIRKTLQGSGHWGAVRVVGSATQGADLSVSGRILAAGGKHLRIEVKAVDATGKEWLSRRYEGQADLRAYRKAGTGLEPFQSLYNRLANDLSAVLAKQGAKDVARIRQVARLRFARELAPRAFEGYLKADGKRTSLRRLPAEGDPMAARVDALREREGMLIDTLDEHYATFGERLQGSYDEWRRSSYDEQDQLDRARRDAKLKGLLGLAAILGAVLVGSSCDSRYDNCGLESTAGEVAVVAGSLAIQAALRSHAEAKIHAAALREMAVSLDAEVQPVLVEVEGRTRTLKGSAETQFAAWRTLLAELFTAETGLAPSDLETARP